MADTSTEKAKVAADQAADQTAAAVVEEGSSTKETEKAATAAAADAARSAAPELSDEQIERIASASGKAAARETITELQKMGALREDDNSPDITTGPPVQTQPVDQHGGSPPPGPTVTQSEIQQEPPKRLKPAERFIGRKQ